MTAVDRLTAMGIERNCNLGVCPAELCTASFANRESGVSLNDPQFSLGHENSVALNACAKRNAVRSSDSLAPLARLFDNELN